jgi:hypothetical protein
MSIKESPMTSAHSWMPMIHFMLTSVKAIIITMRTGSPLAFCEAQNCEVTVTKGRPQQGSLAILNNKRLATIIPIFFGMYCSLLHPQTKGI